MITPLSNHSPTATDQFAAEIKPHCIDVSDNLTEKFVKIFQKSTPSVQRFAERKFQLIMEEQDRDIAVSDVIAPCTCTHIAITPNRNVTELHYMYIITSSNSMRTPY